jgi:Tol biopolymer transport system component/DNA-binding winged helix-turn-helix (wHTH) protein
MEQPSRVSYEFEDYRLDVGKRVLLRRGEPIPLTPKAFDTLLVLIRNSERAVGKDELLKEVWPGTSVEEATLTQNVFTLRRALGHAENGELFIKTVPKYGYRFVAAVRESPDDAEAQPETRNRRPVADEAGPAGGHGAGGNAESVSYGMPAYAGRARAHATPNSSPSSDTHEPVSHTRFSLGRNRRSLLLVVLIFGAVTAAVLFFQGARIRGRRSRAAPLSAARVTKLTNQGKVVRAVISPDGKYVAYARQEGNGRQSLWVKQVRGSNDLEVAPSAAVNFQGITFSPDGESIYYVAYRNDNPVAALYRVPLLGGTASQILVDVDSAVTFSPDGKRLAFMRNDLASRVTALLTANADGTGERKVAESVGAGFFSGEGPAWSPDGEEIACAAGDFDESGAYMTVVAVSADGGPVRPLTAHRWAAVGQVAWLADRSGIILDGWDMQVSALSKGVWEVTLPDGTAHTVTNDLNDYVGVSVSRNSDAVVTVKAERAANFWVTPEGDFGGATQITSGGGDPHGEQLGMAWTPDGRIVYSSTTGGGLSLWVMNADGGDQKQLTADQAQDFRPNVAPDGQSAVFTSLRGGSPHVWAVDMDGKNLRRLTNGHAETWPLVTPDNRWLVYVSADEKYKPTLWKAPLGGGEASRLSDYSATRPSASPDGSVVACFYRERPDAPLRLSVIPMSGGAPLKVFDIPPSAEIFAGIQWTPDGRGLAYVDTADGVSNLWLQPLEGGAPRQMTRFTSDNIYRFAVSKDGKRAAFERGVENSDVVLINADPPRSKR